MHTTTSYLILVTPTDQGDLHRQGRGYLGKLRSNFVGTEFQVPPRACCVCVC